MSHNTTSIRLVSTSAAGALVVASAGFGAVFAYQTGLPHGWPLAVLSVVFAVSLELLKPLAVSAAISAACSWQFVRSALLALLATVAVVYSLTAELSLLAGSRSDYTASRQHVVSSASRSSEQYASAKEELAALAPSRLLAEIEADKKRYAHIETRLAKLTGEAARAKRRVELQEVLRTGVEPSFGSADPGTSALALYLSYIGYAIPTDQLAQWLYLVPVLALEIGSALGMVLVNAVAPPKEPSMVHSEPSIAANRLYTRDEAAKRLMQHLMDNGGSLLRSERDIAKAVGSDRNTTRRALQGLGAAGLLEYKPTKKGTELKLVS
jgi:hypothetical protein